MSEAVSESPSTPDETDKNGSRLRREAEFHDSRFAENTRAMADKFYAITSDSVDYYRDRVLTDIGGRQLLEYGCGTGSMAFDAAQRGAHTTGIDISPVAIDLANRTAHQLGLRQRERFQLDNAEALELPDASVDVVLELFASL